MTKRRKMNVDDRKRAYVLGIVLMIVFINIFYFCIRGQLNQEDTPYEIIATAAVIGSALCFVAGMVITKLRMGPDHSMDIDKEEKLEEPVKKHFND